MKKTIVIMVVLLVGLLFLGGCTSTADTPQDQQQTQTPEPGQNQQQAGTDDIPTPPALPEE